MKNSLCFLICLIGLFKLDLSGQDLNIPVHYQLCDNCSSSEGGDDLETEYTYGQLLPYRSRDVTSDFGARYLGYDWHKGVDYKPLQVAGGGRGTAIIAAETGSVHTISANNGFKYIAIDGANNFGYGHIFNSRNPSGTYLQSGAFVLKAMDTPNTDEYAIINLETGVAIAAVSGKVTLDGTEYTVETTEVESTSQAIAPMGGSGGSNGDFYDTDPFAVHLHLYQFRDIDASSLISYAHETNCMDPLAVVSHDQPTYDVKLRTQGQNQLWNVKLGYPGTAATKFQVRPIMARATDTGGNLLGEDGAAVRYGNVVLNINDVEINIKKRYEEDFYRIQGATYESLVSHGATLNTVLYPTYMALDNRRGSWNRQGIASFAYYDNANGHPYDDFYFTDFYTRIHRDDPMDGDTPMVAYCPEQARYNDGEYDLEARVTTVREAEHKAEASFILDNYMPYIRAVTLTARQIGCFPHHAAPLH